MYFLVRVKNPLAALWPLLGIGIIAASMALIIGVSEHLRHRSEAKQERQERLAKKNAEKTVDAFGNVQPSPLAAFGGDVTLRPNAKAEKGLKETIQ